MFLASLAADLRTRSVTTYITVDVPTIVAPELSFAGTPLVVFTGWRGHQRCRARASR